MKTTIGIAISILVASLGSPGAMAQESGFYVGAGAGVVSVDFDDATVVRSGGVSVPGSGLVDFDRSPILTLQGGYQWGSWALELEFERSVSDTDMRLVKANTQGDFRYRNFKVQGVYRSQGDLYFMGKLGWNEPDLDVNIPGSQFGLGRSEFLTLGGGFRFGSSMAVELGYSVSRHDTDTFTLGLRHRF